MGYAAAVIADAPKAFWTLGEASGAFADTSGNGNASTGNSGTITYGQTSLMPDAAGTSTRIVGGSSYISLPALFDWSLAFTLEFWIKKNSNPTTYGAIFCKNQDSQNYAFITTSSAGGGMGCSIKPSNNGNGSNTAITNGVAYHYAVTVTSGTDPTILWYRNGQPDGGGVVTTARNNSGSVRFGATPDSFWGGFDGWLQNAAAFDKVLTAAQVLTHYNGAFFNSVLSG